MLKYELGQRVMYKGKEVKIVGIDGRSYMLSGEYPYAIDVFDKTRTLCYDKNISKSCITELKYIDTDKDVYTWVREEDLSEIKPKPKAVKVNLDNIMEVGKWFMELTGRKMFASRGMEFYKGLMDGTWCDSESIWLVETDNGDIHFNHDREMMEVELMDTFEVLEYKKEDKGMRFEKEGFEFRGWKLGEEVMYEGEKTRIVGADLGLIGGHICIACKYGWDFEASSCKNNVEDPVFVEGIKGKCLWVLESWLEDIAPKTTKTKIYSFADLHGKQSACGNFFIEATPALIKVWTKTANRDGVGVFHITSTSKNTLADLTNFGFELYELVEFELSDFTKNKFAGFGDKKVCKLSTVGDILFVKVFHDGKSGLYDTISLTKKDKINKAEFLVGEVK